MEHTGLLFLFTCQPTKSSNFSRSGVNVRAHLLRKNYSRNFSSIRSAPWTHCNKLASLLLKLCVMQADFKELGKILLLPLICICTMVYCP